MPHKPYPSPAEVLALDAEFAAAGVPVTKRATKAMLRWMQTPPYYGGVVDFSAQGRWFDDRWKELHPSVAMSDRPFMYLAVSALGVSYRCDPPIIFGRVGINPMKLIKIQPEESHRIWTSAPEVWWELHHQAVDCIDLFLNSLDFTGPEQAGRWKAVAVGQLQTAARQLVACAHDASLAQTVSLISEMAMKAALVTAGMSEAELKAKFGHKLEPLARRLCEERPSASDADLMTVITTVPNYTPARYEAPDLTMPESQDYYRRALFVASDALRRVGRHDAASSVRNDTSIPIRKWV